jgi:cytochrome c oxidase assembly factor CtaG
VAAAEWIPALLVVSLPPRLARRVTVPMVPALLVWVATYFVWHLPAAYDFALRHPHSVLHLEHASYLVAGAILWWPVFHGGARSGTKAVYLFAAFALASPLGLLLALLPDPAYAFYESRPTVWGMSHLLDQEVAGTTMAAEQAVVFFVACTVFFLRFLREEEDGYPGEVRDPEPSSSSRSPSASRTSSRTS